MLTAVSFFVFLGQSCAGTGDHEQAICRLEEARLLAQKEWVDNTASAYGTTTDVCRCGGVQSCVMHRTRVLMHWMVLPAV